MEEEKKEKAFVVRDKRLFNESGQPRAEAPSTAEAAPVMGSIEKEEPPPDAKKQSQPDVEAKSQSQEAAPVPEVNFYNFILSLSSTAMYHFGDFSDSATKESQRNLAAAKQTIDLLSMLQEKTKGNLNQDEKNLLDGILYELRIRYVKEMAEG